MTSEARCEAHLTLHDGRGVVMTLTPSEMATIVAARFGVKDLDIETTGTKVSVTASWGDKTKTYVGQSMSDAVGKFVVDMFEP